MLNSSFSFLPFKGVFNDLLSLSWLSFCQPARTVSLSLSLSLSTDLSLLSFDSSLVPLPPWPMLLTHSENGSSSFRRSIMPSSYTNQVIAVAAKGTETWCTKMEGYNVPAKFLFPSIRTWFEESSYKMTKIITRIYVYVYSSNKTIKLSVGVLRNSWKQKLYRLKRYIIANEDESISSVFFLRKE